MRLSRVCSIGERHGVRMVLFFIVFLIGIIWVWRSAMMSADRTLPSPMSPMVERVELRGLTTSDRNFLIDGKKMKIFSGAMHYFRVVPEYWRDRMLKMKAAGLNTLETYVPWNLHEEIRGEFNFKGMADLRSFIKTAHDLGLYVIVRPGPYICSEWDFGGLPSWLLHDPYMKVRSTYGPYLAAVESYFAVLFPEIIDLQYSQGGPIIAFQIENEYGGYGNEVAYLSWLKHAMGKHGVVELMFTSDNNGGIMRGSLPAVLMTANFKSLSGGEEIFNYLIEKQPTEPLMVMEYWSGWFDHWGETHNTQLLQDFKNVLKFILDADGSVNFYMFHGGTNFGFMNGANPEGPGSYTPTITSYDYDAPLSESGATTRKFFAIRDMLPSYMLKQKDLPEVPPAVPSFAYGMVTLSEMLPLSGILAVLKPLKYDNVKPMEMIDINNGGGQGYGYILYRRKFIPKSDVLQIKGNVRDRASVLLNGREVAVFDWTEVDPSVRFDQSTNVHWEDENTLDILVENMGRINYAGYQSPVLNQQRKGLFENTVFLDDILLNKWEIFPLQFKTKFVNRVDSSLHWTKTPDVSEIIAQPALYRGHINIAGPTKDTFLDFRNWERGVIFVNRFNIGRYWNKGPQKTLYIPAPMLRTGDNEILIFELHRPHSSVTLLNKALLE